MVLGFGLQGFLQFLSSLATSELNFGEYGFFLQLSSFVSVSCTLERWGLRDCFKFGTASLLDGGASLNAFLLFPC